MKIVKIIFSLSIILCVRADAARGGLVFENIIYSEQVNRNGTPPNSKTTFFEFPPSPNAIAFSQTAMIKSSFATGNYDAQWSGDSAVFQSSISHHLQGFEGSLSSSGNFRVRPAVDSIVNLSGTWTYNHYPSLLGRTVFAMTVREIGPGTLLWGGSVSGGTVSLNPPTGTLTFDGSILLQAGELYSLTYSMTTTNFDPPPPNAQWLGNGQIHITINPVPEPTTLALLGLAIPFLIRRITPTARNRMPRHLRN